MSSEQSSPCLSEDVLKALAEGGLGEEKVFRCENHLSNCVSCQERLENLTGFDEIFVAGSPANHDSEKSSILQNVMEGLSKGVPVSSSRRLTDEPLDFLEPADKPNQLGKIGQYEIMEEIARGGSGIILKGYDTELQRIVAIKFLSPDLAQSSDARERFLREARAAARLEHDHVMPIYSVDQTGSIPYLVVPYVDGQSLQERLDKSGPLKMGEIIQIGYEVCCALEEAHAHGLVHRDVKPANIMLLEGRNRVWLADFGLASVADAPGQSPEKFIAGTPSYMAPEQAQGAEVDHRADLFSLGCVLHAMVSGASPFQADSPHESMEKVIHQAASPLSEVPDWFSRLVANLLAKDPGKRPVSARSVGAVLEKQLPDKPRGSRKRRFFLIGLVAIIIPLVVWLTQDPRNPQQGYIVASHEEVIHSSLSAAIAAAESGDTIIVKESGEINVGMISIREKALTLRAAPGSHPVFVADNARSFILQSNAPLCVEGIDFKHPQIDDPAEALPLLRCRSGPVFLANCRFTRPVGSQEVIPRQSPSMIAIEECPLVEMVNCEIHNEDGRGLSVSGATKLTNNLFTGRIALQLTPESMMPYSWSLERNTFSGAVAMMIWHHNRRVPMGEIELHDNFFGFERRLLMLRGQENDQPLEITKISGTGNLYQYTGTSETMKGSYVTLLPKSIRGSLDSYQEFAAAFGETGREVSSNERDGAGCDHTILGPGESFDRWRESEAYTSWKKSVGEAMK